MSQDAASSGTTDVAAEGFQEVERPAEDEEVDATLLNLGAGALFAAGNSRSASVTSTGNFRLRRDANQFKAALAFNYARAAPGPGESMETTVDNAQGNVRYDRFITERMTLFLSTSARRDQFQGIDVRVNIDPGVGYYLIDKSTQQLWGELGYDLEYEVRSDEAVAEAAAAGEPVDKTNVQHAARLFIGYQHNLNEHVSLNTGLEYLQAVTSIDVWRMYWYFGFNSAIGGRFSVSTTASVQYDNEPLPGVQTTDVTSAVSLVYTLL